MPPKATCVVVSGPFPDGHFEVVISDEHNNECDDPQDFKSHDLALARAYSLAQLHNLPVEDEVKA